MYLNDMWEMLVRFGHQEYGLTRDISKAYYQMYIGPFEEHVRRVLWRDNKVGTPWRMYGFKVVSMGDTPAACFMELTRKRTAVKGGDLDPSAAKRIQKDAFVDDITTGGNKAECVRFKGVEDPVTLKCDGTIPQILAVGGYSVKAMCIVHVRRARWGGFRQARGLSPRTWLEYSYRLARGQVQGKYISTQEGETNWS